MEEKEGKQAASPSLEPTQASSQEVQCSAEKEYKTFLTKLKLYVKDPVHLATIQKAYEYAEKCHEEQKRRSGEPYIIHPLAVATILTELKVDVPSILAALLHDVVEDTEATLEDIEAGFGKEVANLVDGLTKIGKITFRSTQERLAENFRKMILAMAKDLRVILVKLADRLHNMRTLGSLPPPKRRAIAQETLDIYSPLASRLGIYNIKSELEDLCLKEIKYEVYKDISRKIAAKKREREDYILEVKEFLEKEMNKYGFKSVQVYGRPKHFYSIYKKMVDRQLAFEDIHDLFAFRIIVDSLKDCYEALGIVHSLWKPMPGRFKDYIAMPKANFYQSLHTTVIRPNGTTAEIQIRTKEMHRICEFGVAAHWAYKEQNNQGSAAGNTDLTKFAWLRQIMELQHDVKDPEEFLAAVKVNLFDEEIFVFTPKGDVIQLAQGATPLDFAFAVHSSIGLSTVGAKVNGKITPLKGRLRNGDIIEVITSSHQTPSKDWLNFVITSKAKNKIRSFLRSEQRQSSRKLGKELLNQELAKKGMDLEKLIVTGKIEGLTKTAKESNLDDLCVSIGYGRLNLVELIEKVYPQHHSETIKTYTESHKEDVEDSSLQTGMNKKRKPSTTILVSGMDHILVNISRCCSPLPGEQIVGFITRGRGVSVHRFDCRKALDLDPVRKVPVAWVQDVKIDFFHTTHLRIVTQDRQGVLAEVTAAIASCGSNVQKAQIKLSDNSMGILDFEITLKDLDQLNRVINKIEAVGAVVYVERRSPEQTSKKKPDKEKKKKR